MKGICTSTRSLLSTSFISLPFFFCFQALNVPLTNFFFGSAAVLVGIGLALQDASKDLISGFILLIEAEIKVGDVVRISSQTNDGDLVAKIKKINIRTTQIQTWEGNVLVIPNSVLTRDQVENWSHSSRLTRFTINVTVAYGTDTDVVKTLLETAALSHPKVKKTHQIIIRLSNFGENGLEMELIFWADQHWDIKTYKSDIRFEIDRLFRANNIRIPFPQRTVHVNPNK
jgi:small-conductance mechanosensitive channel